MQWSEKVFFVISFVIGFVHCYIYNILCGFQVNLYTIIYCSLCSSNYYESTRVLALMQEKMRELVFRGSKLTFIGCGW